MMTATMQQQPTPVTAARSDRYAMSDAAKMLGWGRNKLFAWLRQHRIFDNNNVPYQRFIDAGYFKVHHGQFLNKTSCINKHYPRTDITGTGIDWLQQLLTRETAA